MAGAGGAVGVVTPCGDGVGVRHCAGTRPKVSRTDCPALVLPRCAPAARNADGGALAMAATVRNDADGAAVARGPRRRWCPAQRRGKR